jgi:hypothetical protein
MARHSVWEIVFLMVILKIPIVYLGVVVYHAVKAVPPPVEGAAVTARLGGDDDPGAGWRRNRRRARPGPHPHGGPTRSYPRAPRIAAARARGRS